jgi:DNA-binding FadR family transcriptional regulator
MQHEQKTEKERGSSPQAIKRHRIFDQVAENLEAMMLAGELTVGDSLPSERALMERFEVGRPAIREALLWLNKKGLISVSNGERARVIKPDPRDLVEHLRTAALLLVASPDGMQLFQWTRLFTEVALAREAARSATDEDLRELERLLTLNEAATDIPNFARTDDAFHFGIANISRNPVIAALYNSVLEVLQDQRYTSLKHPGALAAAVGCHRRLVEAISSHSPDRAEEEMRRHLSDVETFYWSVRAVSHPEQP